MNKKLLLQLLDIAYPNDELPLDSSKIEHLFQRYNLHLGEITLCDDGKVLANNTFICDISRDGDYLDYALNQMTSVDNSICVAFKNPPMKYLLRVIRAMNKRGKIVGTAQFLSDTTYVYFGPI